MVGNVRVELTSYPYQGYVLTVILISYNGDPRGTRTLKYQRERLMTVSCSSMGPYVSLYR